MRRGFGTSRTSSKWICIIRYAHTDLADSQRAWLLKLLLKMLRRNTNKYSERVSTIRVLGQSGEFRDQMKLGSDEPHSTNHNQDIWIASRAV